MIRTILLVVYITRARGEAGRWELRQIVVWKPLMVMDARLVNKIGMRIDAMECCKCSLTLDHFIISC